MLLDGVHVPLTTPFYPDARLNVRKLEHNVRKLSLTPVSGLIALGPNSESPSLSDEERLQVLQTVAGEAAKEKVLIAGIGTASVLRALHLAEAAAGLQFDAVLLDAPVEYDHLLQSADGPTAALQTYFQAVADGSPLPVILWSDALRAPLPIALIEQLSSHPNVIGLLEQSRHVSRVVQVKEATGDVSHSVTTTVTFTAATARMLAPAANREAVGGTFVSAAALTGGLAVAVAEPVPALKTRVKQVGFQVMWGSATDAIAALRAGANGLAMPLAASVPQAAFEVWAAWKDGNAALMAEKQGRLQRAEDGIPAYDIPAIKAASELSGYFGGRPRLPLLQPTAERVREITALLQGMRS